MLVARLIPPLHLQGRGTARRAVEGPAAEQTPPPRACNARSPSPPGRNSALQISLGLVVSTLALATAAHAERHTYANPIDIDYRYNWEERNQGISYRTGADPAIVVHKGAYYLFETLADGYWRSTNLVDWTFVKPSRWPFEGVVAPAAWSDGERLYLKPAAMEPGAILVSDDPASGKLEFLTRRTPELPGAVRPGLEDRIAPGQIGPGPWDPALFKDDDGRWYLYWGSSNVFPIYGIELDPERALAYRGQPKPLFGLDPARHGWERFGRDHSGTGADGIPVKPFVEGAWMTKVAGRYYLQYAAPGTEYNAYANGTYVSDSPLGPFTYAPYNPVAYKPGGFVEGAGHGSTFRDLHGNWWNSGTPWIGYNWTFERRIAIFPAKFEADGEMRVSTRFGDFPHYVPEGPAADPESLFTGWMLLSYLKPATASSTLGTFGARNVTDENPRTFWVASSNRPGETLTVDLGGLRTLRAVQVDYADYRSGRFADAPDVYTEFALLYSADGRTWSPLAATGTERRDRPNAYFELPRPVRARFVRYVHGHVGAATLAISDLRIFGAADGSPPAAPGGLAAVREADARNADVRWRPVPGAVGYNVRWGIRPDRLTLTYQVFARDAAHANRSDLALRALNVGQAYYVAIEAFNESGVSKLSPVLEMKQASQASRR
ncbi:MAG: coagulation factor 5/8 type domain protein [Alphaproteobacteria bacterium]|nr:coagulation factor 5/8 type domain protein [Alphaproteobacteria bacterium]